MTADATAFQEVPYWWADVPARESERRPLPARADVAVIGAGYPGLWVGRSGLTMKRSASGTS